MEILRVFVSVQPCGAILFWLLVKKGLTDPLFLYQLVGWPAIQLMKDRWVLAFSHFGCPSIAPMILVLRAESSHSELPVLHIMAVL